MPLVSVNLCCYNSEKFLEETLQSVFAQTFTDWELVIINDGSKDSTDAIIRRHIAEGRNIVYHPQPNAGLGASRNKAIELSSGKYIALIDHDDVWEPRKLELMVPRFERDEVALVYSNAEIVNAANERIGSYAGAMHRGRVLPELFLNDFIACSTVMMRRSAVDASGSFRRDLHIAEEYELFLRLAAKYEFDYVDQPLMRWRLHENNASLKVRQGRDENARVLGECLARAPELETVLGRRAIRLRSGGFTCSMRQARLLDHPLAAIRDEYSGNVVRALIELPKPLLAYLISYLPLKVSDAIVRLWWQLRRRRTTA